MESLQKAIATIKHFFGRFDEPEYAIPDVSVRHPYTPPAVRRHLLAIKAAMMRGDRVDVANRQMRLVKLGVGVPTKLSEVEQMLDKYGS